MMMIFTVFLNTLGVVSFHCFFILTGGISVLIYIYYTYIIYNLVCVTY